MEHHKTPRLAPIRHGKGKQVMNWNGWKIIGLWLSAGLWLILFYLFLLFFSFIFNLTGLKP
jgi:hypothetical protein